MAGVNFTDQQTIIRTDWLQGVNDLFYRVFLTPSTLEDIRVILPEATQENKGFISPDDLIKLNDIDSPFGIRNFEVEDVTSSRALTVTDRYKYLRANSVNLVEITVPTNALEPFAIGEFVYVEKANDGNVLFSASPGVTLTTPGALGIADLHAITGLIKIAEDEWLVVNNSTPFATVAGDLAVGTAEAPYLHTYDRATLTKIESPLQPPTGEVERVRYSPNGNFLAVLTTTDNLIVYDTSTYQRVVLAAQPLMTRGRGLAFSPDNAILVARNTGYDTSDWSIIDNDVFNLNAITEASEDVTYRPDQVYVVSGNIVPDDPSSVAGGRDIRDGTTLQIPPIGFSGLTGQVYANSHNPDSTLHVYCKSTAVSQPSMSTAFTNFYNPFQPNIIFLDLPSLLVRAVKFTSDGSTIVVGDTETPYLKLYNPVNGSRITDPTLQPPGQVNDMVLDNVAGRFYVAHDSAPYFTIYDEDTFAEITGPEITPGANANTIATPNLYGGS